MTPKRSGRTNQTAWAVVMKGTGKLCHDLTMSHFAIYRYKVDAFRDCPNYAEVIKVRVSELRSK